MIFQYKLFKYLYDEHSSAMPFTGHRLLIIVSA